LSSSESDFHPSASRKVPSRPQHSRSMSSTFPSLFTSSKKKKADNQEEVTSDSDNEEDGYFAPRNWKEKARRLAPRAEHARHSSKDFATGSCMTCGSNMRWPKELHTFRC